MFENQIWTGEAPYIQCKNTIQLTGTLLNAKRTPENPKQPMDLFYTDQPKERDRGALLKSKVAVPCWSREPNERPKMAVVEEILQADFRDLIDIQ